MRALIVFIVLSFAITHNPASVAASERVNLEAVTIFNGGQFIPVENRATMRLPSVIAIVFDGSDRVIVGGTEVQLPEIVKRIGNIWYAPIEFIYALNLRTPSATDRIPQIKNGFNLSWEEFDLGRGVKALQLFQRATSDAADQASLVIADFGTLAQINPELKKIVSKFLRDFRVDHPGHALYFSVVAERNAVALPISISFVQGAQQFLVESNAGMLTLEGHFPGESIGLILMPISFDPHKPVRVTWGFSTAEYIFSKK